MHRTRWSRTILPTALSALLLQALPARADDAGLAGVDPPPWARWQGRVSLGLTGAADRGLSLGSYGAAALQLDRLSVLGDYYFGEATRGLGRAGGFRATSGVIVGSRTPLWTGQASLTSARGLLGVERQVTGAWTALPAPSDPAVDTSPVPYFGVGYTGLSLRSGWSFSADLGMVARNPGNMVKLGRVFTGSQGVDDLLRELRLAPMLQLGMSYSF